MYLKESLDQAKNVLLKLGVVNQSGFEKLKEILNPNFGYLPLFTKFHYRDKISLSRIEGILDIIKEYSHLLKSSKIIPLDYDNFEKLDDDINKAIIRNENLKFAKSFISNKYAHLLSEEGISLFGELKKLESSHKKVQDYMMKKIAAFKTSEEFNTALSSLINSLSGGWDGESVMSRVEVGGGILVHHLETKNPEGSIVIAKIPNYKASKELGSTSWCISRSESYFKHYTLGFGVQYFIWNTSIPQSDPYSLIGVTIDYDGRIKASHDRRDGSIYDNNRYISLIKKYLKGPNKEDILNLVRNGIRVDNYGFAKFEIKKQEVLDIDPNYFKTSKELIRDIKSGTNLKVSEIKRLSLNDYSKFMSDLLEEKEYDRFWSIFKSRGMRGKNILDSIIESGQVQNLIKNIKITPSLFTKIVTSDKFNPVGITLPNTHIELIPSALYEYLDTEGQAIKSRGKKDLKKILDKIQHLSDFNPTLKVFFTIMAGLSKIFSIVDETPYQFWEKYEFVKYSYVKNYSEEGEEIIMSIDIEDLLEYVEDGSLNKRYYRYLFNKDPITFQDILKKPRFDTGESLFKSVSNKIYRKLSKENKEVVRNHIAKEIRTFSGYGPTPYPIPISPNEEDVLKNNIDDFVGKITNTGVVSYIDNMITRDVPKPKYKYLFSLLDKTKKINNRLLIYSRNREKISSFKEFKDLLNK